ncbi:hypothetical protein SDC9_202443 [bioreactor metagenome]|uniref:Uncharacterized protein n=1 Tax=bioreactor metagenome TaxID=1076179 RepID=A0A645IUC9_9ZZZZ
MAPVLPFPLQMGGEPEATPRPRYTVDAGVAPHQPGQPPGDRQPEAGATVTPGRGIVGLLERREQLFDHFRRNADPGIADRKPNQDAIDVFRHALDQQFDLALAGELDSVASQVE